MYPSLYRSRSRYRYAINTGTGHFRKFGTISIPVPNTSGSSVHQYRHRTLRQVRYINTGTGHFGKFGTISTPVSDISAISVRHPCTGTGHFGKFGTIWIPVPAVPVQTFIPVPDTSVRYSIITGTGHFGKFGTSIPVPDPSVTSLRHPYRYRAYRYRTEHTLAIYYNTTHHNKKTVVVPL